MLTALPGSHRMHAHMPHLVHLGIVVYSNILLHVSLFLLSTDLKRYLPSAREGLSPTPQRGYGRPGPWGGEGHRHPFFQDTNSQQRDIVGRGEHEGQVPSQNASVRIRRIVLCLCTDQRFPTRREGRVSL